MPSWAVVEDRARISIVDWPAEQAAISKTKAVPAGTTRPLDAIRSESAGGATFTLRCTSSMSWRMVRETPSNGLGILLARAIR
jgi:hypothetical protein